MARIDNFNFTPTEGWANELEFPNYADESTNREMMNRLPFQLKTFINETVLPVLNQNTELLDYKVTSDDIKGIRTGADNTIEVTLDGEEWIVISSSGHVIYNGDTAMPQRSRLRFENVEMEDNGVEIVIRGLQGEQGIQGIQGDKGATGDKGEQGEKGAMFYPEVAENGDISWSVQEYSTSVPPIRNIRGPQGVQGIQGNPGADGRSFKIKDVYATLGELKLAFPNGSFDSDNEPYAYYVDDEDVVYLWSIDQNSWVSMGGLQGPQGPQGIQGVQGPQGERGATGPTGPGIPTGGTALQVLVKDSNSNYDTKWVTLTSTTTATLSAANWSSGIYTLTVNGVTATSFQEILPSESITTTQLEAYQGANIQAYGQSVNTIKLKAFGDVPTVDIPILVVLRGDI